MAISNLLPCSHPAACADEAGACQWCADLQRAEARRMLMRDERDEAARRIYNWETERNSALCERDKLAAALAQVDDVLVVNWIDLKGGDYRKALADLVTDAILDHDDPLVSEIAAKRKAEHDSLVAQAAVMRQALELMVSPIQHADACLSKSHRNMPCQCGYSDSINGALRQARSALASTAGSDLLAEIEGLRKRASTLEALIVRRTGAASFEEWQADLDLTERTPAEIIDLLRKRVADLLEAAGRWRSGLG